MTRRKNKAKIRLAEVLLSEPTGQRHYGLDLMRAAHLGAGRLYPLLDDLLARGWVSDGWADPDERFKHRRRYYVLTVDGRHNLLANTWLSP